MKIPNSIPLDKNGQYCVACFSDKVQRVFKANLTYYECPDCGNLLERILAIDDSVAWWLDEERNYWHESVGVIVTVENKILTQLRQIYPFAYSIPAGHLDQGEESEPEKAAQRELREETGIIADSLELLKDNFDMPGDSCRRASDHHRWHLYKLKMKEFPELTLSEEASKFEWMTLDELKNNSQLTYPLKFFVDTMGEKLF